MAKIDTHNMTMRGLRKAAGETKGLTGYNGYVQISYDTNDGEVISRRHLAQSNYTQYEGGTILHICNALSHMTMQQIADAVAAKIA